MQFIAEMPVLAATDEAERLTAAIVDDGAIPVQAVRDAAHIAVATVNAVDYLLTWNCKHLANARVMRRVADVCYVQGFCMPLICTPEELMEG